MSSKTFTLIKDQFDPALFGCTPVQAFEQASVDQQLQQLVPEYVQHLRRFAELDCACTAFASGQSKLIFAGTSVVYKVYKTRRAYTQERVNHRLLQQFLHPDAEQMLAHTTWHDYYCVQELVQVETSTPDWPYLTDCLLDKDANNFGNGKIIDFENINLKTLRMTINEYFDFYYEMTLKDERAEQLLDQFDRQVVGFTPTQLLTCLPTEWPEYAGNLHEFAQLNVDCRVIASGYHKLVFQAGDRVYKVYKTHTAYEQDKYYYDLTHQRFDFKTCADTTWHDYYCIQELCTMDYDSSLDWLVAEPNGVGEIGKDAQGRTVVVDFGFIVPTANKP